MFILLRQHHFRKLKIDFNRTKQTEQLFSLEQILENLGKRLTEFSSSFNEQVHYSYLQMPKSYGSVLLLDK